MASIRQSVYTGFGSFSAYVGAFLRPSLPRLDAQLDWTCMNYQFVLTLSQVAGEVKKQGNKDKRGFEVGVSNT